MSTPELHQAQSELLDLAGAVRPDIRRDDLEGAIVACRYAGWTWRRTLSEVVQMLCRSEEPRDLRKATEDPLKRPRRAS